MSSVNLWEARLVTETIDCPDPRLPSSTALSWGNDGVAHTPICQPAGAAVVQTIVPCCVQLSCSGQLGSQTQTVALGLQKPEALWGRAMEHLTFKGQDSFVDSCFISLLVHSFSTEYLVGGSWMGSFTNS